MAAHPEWSLIDRGSSEEDVAWPGDVDHQLRTMVWPPVPEEIAMRGWDRVRRRITGEERPVRRRLRPIEAALRGRDLGLVIQDAAAGEHSARVALYERYYPRVYERLHWGTGDEHAAHDLAQAVFERLWQALAAGSYDGRPFWPWLKAITKNAMIDDLRKRRRIELTDPLIIGERLDNRDDGLAVDPLGWLTDEQLEASFAMLGQRQRQVLVLSYEADLPDATIAQVLEISEGGVRNARHEGLRRLEERWGARRVRDIRRPEPRLTATRRPVARRAASGFSTLPHAWTRIAGGRAIRGF